MPVTQTPMTAVEKAELARLRIAAPTTVAAFAEARAQRLAVLEARYAAESSTTTTLTDSITPAWDAAFARQARAERNVK